MFVDCCLASDIVDSMVVLVFYLGGKRQISSDFTVECTTYKFSKRKRKRDSHAQG